MQTAVLLWLWALLAQAPGPGPQEPPQYTADNQFFRPEGYREWIFLSSGLGMTYDPGRERDPRFTNVFVTP